MIIFALVITKLYKFSFMEVQLEHPIDKEFTYSKVFIKIIKFHNFLINFERRNICTVILTGLQTKSYASRA